MTPENCYIDEHVLQKGKTLDTNKAYIPIFRCNMEFLVHDFTWVFQKYARNAQHSWSFCILKLLILELFKFPNWMLCSGYHAFVFFRCQLRSWFQCTVFYLIYYVIFLSSLKWCAMNAFVIILEFLETSYNLILWYSTIIWQETKECMDFMFLFWTQKIILDQDHVWLVDGQVWEGKTKLSIHVNWNEDRSIVLLHRLWPNSL
jgi:hypothetical protein